MAIGGPAGPKKRVGAAEPVQSTPMRVPPVQVQFPADDRPTVRSHVDTAHSTGQLTLRPLGAELHAAFAAR